MALPALPREIIYEIVSRTSLIGLGRCRLVSKEWNSMTYESDFMQDHCRRTKTISGFFRQNKFLVNGNNSPLHDFVSVNDLDRDNEISLNFLPATIQITATTKQGIILCKKWHYTGEPGFYVCKPTTREWLEIPDPKSEYGTRAIGMVVLNSKPLRYKIVQFSAYKEGRPELQCEVFDSETWVWKRLEDLLMPSCETFGYEDAICVGGKLYWRMGYDKAFEFREDTESWSTFDVPFPVSDDFGIFKLVQYEAHLAIIDRKENSGELWVMEDIDGQVWRKREIISIEYEFHVLCMYSSDAIFFGLGYCDKYYNFKSFKSKIFKELSYCFPPAVFPFQSDFEHVNLWSCGRKK